MHFKCSVIGAIHAYHDSTLPSTSCVLRCSINAVLQACQSIHWLKFVASSSAHQHSLASIQLRGACITPKNTSRSFATPFSAQVPFSQGTISQQAGAEQSGQQLLAEEEQSKAKAAAKNAKKQRQKAKTHSANALPQSAAGSVASSAS